MKKGYLSLIALGLVAGLNAQTMTNELRTSTNIETKKPVKPAISEKATVIWSNDFANTAHWTASNNTFDAQNWVWSNSTDPNMGYGTGPWVDAANTVTNENGYALFDSDLVGSNGGTQDAYYEYTGPTSIDCGAYANVVISFNQRVRMWQTTQTFVEVSNDNGVTWFSYEVNADKPVSVAYEENVVINVTNSAGNNNGLRVRLHYVGSWDYLWAVDDLMFIEQPSNDMRSSFGYISGTADGGIEYGRMPLTQVPTSWAVGGQVTNFGASDQTNVSILADFGSFSSTFAAGTVLSGDTVNWENTESPALAVGVYNGTYTVSQTEVEDAADLVNNVSLRSFEVTNGTTGEYSLDGIGVHPASVQALASLGSNSFTGGEDGVFFGNQYIIRNTMNFYAVKVMLTASSQAGCEIEASVHDTVTILADDADSPLFTSGTYVLTAQDVTNGFAVIPFTSGGTLNPGVYYAGVKLFSNAGAAHARILDDQTVVQPGLASVINIPGDATYTNGNAMGVRLIGGTVGLNENTLEGVNVYPNPSTGVVNVSNDNNTSNTITVYDVAGKVVMTKTVATATSFDLSAAGTGVYMVEVANANGKKVERVVIK